jgi:uncharacterized protein (TIGR00297 family)
MKFLTLDQKGVFAAIILGCVLFVFGFLAVAVVPLRVVWGVAGGALFLITLFWFLLLSAISTGFGKRMKTKLGLYEDYRGYKNVAANGLGPALFAIITVVFGSSGHSVAYWAALVGFVTCVAAITSDKFSSEIGVMDGPPRMIFTFVKVKKGVSGGITRLGLVAGFAGAVLVSVLVLPFALVFGIPQPVYAIVAVTIGGFVGTISDSMLGFYESRGIGNKHTSNFVSSIIGALWGMALFMLFIAIIH